ncbi:MAG: archease [FCB group bacterium]|nr:archease [FCB group bacterium]
MHNFEISDRFTIADIGLTLEGDSLTELFLAGAEGMMTIILGVTPSQTPAETVNINLTADSREQLLVDWLSELIYLFDAKNLIPVSYNISVEQNDRFTLSGKVAFRIFSGETETAEHDIKAVTYYKLKIEEHDGLYRCHPVFDL